MLLRPKFQIFVNTFLYRQFALSVTYLFDHNTAARVLVRGFAQSTARAVTLRNRFYKMSSDPLPSTYDGMFLTQVPHFGK